MSIPIRMIQNAIPVWVNAADGERVSTYAILDPCSTVNILVKELKDQLRLNGKQSNLTLNTASGCQRHVSEIVQLELQDMECKNNFPIECHVLSLRHLKTLNTPVQSDYERIPELDHLRGINIDVPYVSLIIGSCGFELFTPWYVYKLPGGLVITKTSLGFAFFGPSTQQPQHSHHIQLVTVEDCPHCHPRRCRHHGFPRRSCPGSGCPTEKGPSALTLDPEEV